MRLFPLAGQGFRISLDGPPLLALKPLDTYSDGELQRLDRLLTLAAVATDALLRCRDMAAVGDHEAAAHNRNCYESALMKFATAVDWRVQP